MRRHVASRIGLRAAIVIVAVSLPLILANGLGELTPSFQITVAGTPVQVSQGTTFEGAILSFSLHPRSGRLLDVDGRTIRRLAPGAILLNGAQAARSTALAPGDAILVLDGVDRTEATRRVTTRLRGPRPADPQFTLSTSRLLRVAVVGRVSGKVVSVAYRRQGPVRTPRAVALTFDDGPWPGSSRRILAILQRMHVKATFFLIGYLAERYPAIVRAEMAAGMPIANHSWDHPNSPPFARLPAKRIETEMSMASGMLASRYGVRPTMFRPPGGSFDVNVVTTADGLGMRVVLWDVDPRDWASGATARSVAATVLRHVRPGSIVDLHDGGGDRSATVRALPRIVRGIRRRGLRLVALSP